jgi:hypothetical protein
MHSSFFFLQWPLLLLFAFAKVDFLAINALFPLCERLCLCVSVLKMLPQNSQNQHVSDGRIIPPPKQSSSW